MNEEREDIAIIAALVARAGGKVTLTLREIAELRSRILTVNHLPADGGIEIKVDMPTIRGEFRVLEGQRP